MITATMSTQEFLAYRKSFAADLRAGVLPIVYCEDYTMQATPKEIASTDRMSVMTLYCEKVPFVAGGNRCDYIKVSVADRQMFRQVLERLYGHKDKYVCIELSQ